MHVELPPNARLRIGAGVDIGIGEDGTVLVARRRRGGWRAFLWIVTLPPLVAIFAASLIYLTWNAVETLSQTASAEAPPAADIPRSATERPAPAPPPRVVVPPAEVPRQGGADPFGG